MGFWKLNPWFTFSLVKPKGFIPLAPIFSIFITGTHRTLSKRKDSVRPETDQTKEESDCPKRAISDQFHRTPQDHAREPTPPS
jgi:hypothetical protein